VKCWASSTVSKLGRSDLAMIRLIFWFSAALIVYVYFGYPLLLWLLATFFRASFHSERIEPSVSLLIAAYNEAAVIGAKIQNALSLDYPSQQLEIVVASDGSTDATGRVIRSFVESKPVPVRLLEFPINRGKVATLNDAIPSLAGEIVVFSDASSMLAPDSLRHLVQYFADPRVGGVSGVYRVLNKHRARMGVQEDFYWRYETFLKIQEAKLGGFTGAHGSLYCIRRELYPFPGSGTINDDFIIPMRIVERGYRIGYEPKAVAYEEADEMEGYARRVRITAGNIDQLREIKRLLWPPRPVSLFCLLSHKAGRLLIPLAMILLAVLNLLLWRDPFYRWLWWGQVLFYGLAALGGVVKLKPAFLRLPYYFCMINSALFAWVYHALRMGRMIPSRIELDQLGNPPSTAS
jgi:cellulose synthase/poly-beta-1,6-N-acetylglucosamine synthase-like glycosyltransferase